eukprot:TRINITY_DN15028_c0_g2_i1.p1 TRINITY_DN15028_c0_g2~~TRINITY_DN15028_c0_g2_i1.p1  ORF type:complete len:453 (-),score=78.48 TRINITY_DN15028_c0_g2_i1:43-1221(-)
MPGAQDLAAQTMAHLGWSLGACSFKVFKNNEISNKLEQSVSNCDVYIICQRNDTLAEVNFSLMQLFFLIDAVRSESAYRITVILPCLEYARQDRRMVAGEAIPPKLWLRCMKTSGADRFLTIDLHNQAEAGFVPPGTVLDELSADKYLADFVRKNVENFNPDTAIVCATNGGGMKFTRRMADELKTGFMMADRFRPKSGGIGQVKIIADANVDEVKSVIVVDDMVDTCGSLAEVMQAVVEAAPNAKLYGVATHGYFSGEAHLAIKRLAEKGHLEWLAVTNSISQAGAMKRLADLGITDRLKVVDISRLVAGAIIRIHLGASVNQAKFRSLEPSTCDPFLDEAEQVPSAQFVYVAEVADGQSTGIAGKGSGTEGPPESVRLHLKRRLTDFGDD